MFKSVLGLAAALSLASGAAQAAERTVSVTVDGQAIKVPLPEGYCQPTGVYVERARSVASFDTRSETVLTLYDCAAMAAGVEQMERYAHLKFPLAARGQTLTMAEVRDAFPDAPSDFARMMDKAIDEKAFGKELSDLSKQDVTIDVGSLKPVNEDATGVYLAGVMSLQIDGEQIPIATALGVSAVKGKALSFNFYGRGAKVSDVAAQLTQARAAVRALGAANP